MVVNSDKTAAILIVSFNFNNMALKDFLWQLFFFTTSLFKRFLVFTFERLV